MIELRRSSELISLVEKKHNCAAARSKKRPTKKKDPLTHSSSTAESQHQFQSLLPKEQIPERNQFPSGRFILA